MNDKMNKAQTTKTSQSSSGGKRKGRPKGKSNTVQAPVAKGARAGVPRPGIFTSGAATVVVNAESVLELVASITAGSSVTGRLTLSPTSLSLPWLSTVGQVYSKYRVRDLHVLYEPYCPTTIGGEVAAVIVYDENDNQNINTQTILATYGNQRTPVWAPSDPIRYDKSKAAYPWLYCKQNPVNTTLANLSVAGWLLYSYFSNEANSRLGRFMCHYSVEFVDPISPDLNG